MSNIGIGIEWVSSTILCIIFIIWLVLSCQLGFTYAKNVIWMSERKLMSDCVFFSTKAYLGLAWTINLWQTKLNGGGNLCNVGSSFQTVSNLVTVSCPMIGHIKGKCIIFMIRNHFHDNNVLIIKELFTIEYARQVWLKSCSLDFRMGWELVLAKCIIFFETWWLLNANAGKNYYIGHVPIILWADGER